RRREDDQLSRLDEELLLHHDHQSPGDLGAGRLHPGGPAGRHPDRRSLSRRLRRVAARARVRAGEPLLEEAAPSGCLIADLSKETPMRNWMLAAALLVSSSGARAGADLGAVAGFHASLGLNTPAPAPGTVKARVLVLNGADDPFVKPEQYAALKKDMEAAKADYRVVEYPGAVHAFTNPEATEA